jgi:hydrocephalus-inducing protein
MPCWHMQLHWNNDHTLKQEVSFDGNSDISLSIVEPLTSNKEQVVPIKLTARAVFSKYSITPAKGIIFGPQTYNTTSKPRTIEV